jgi:hypothetical protein
MATAPRAYPRSDLRFCRGSAVVGPRSRHDASGEVRPSSLPLADRYVCGGAGECRRPLHAATTTDPYHRTTCGVADTEWIAHAVEATPATDRVDWADQGSQNRP